MSNEKPKIALGHLIHYVSDVNKSEAFYRNLGMTPVMKRDDIAILELRGGTHLLLFPLKEGVLAVEETPFDFMVDNVESFRKELLAHQIEATEIVDQEISGHKMFDIKDPDGSKISVCSSHTEGRIV